MRGRQMDLLRTAMGYRALAVSAASEGDLDRAKSYLDLAMKNAVRRQSQHEIAKTELIEADLLRPQLSKSDHDRLVSSAQEAFDAMGMDWNFAHHLAGAEERSAV